MATGALSMSSSPSAATSAFSWQAASPAEEGFSPDLGEKLDFGLRSGLLRGLHAVLVVRSGRIVLEQYYDGPDESWGDPLGHLSFGEETLHDLRSVTKSIVGLLYGIALEQGLVPPPEARLLESFPQYSDLAGDPQREQLTIEHALTMTLGMEWNEQSPYTDTANSEVAMEQAPDRLRFVLDRPIAVAPGSRWTYSGGATALLGALISQGSGKTLAEFARETLFEALGISAFEWAAGRDGVHSAASGLRLTARDLARIGELVRGLGQWAGQQIVPRGWIEASIRSAIPTPMVSRTSGCAGKTGATAAVGCRLRKRRAKALDHALRCRYSGNPWRALQCSGRLGISDAGLARNCRCQSPQGLGQPYFRIPTSHQLRDTSVFNWMLVYASAPQLCWAPACDPSPVI
jgi:CubicO group peptidase (beta-lactamase class C family)